MDNNQWNWQQMPYNNYQPQPMVFERLRSDEKKQLRKNYFAETDKNNKTFYLLSIIFTVIPIIAMAVWVFFAMKSLINETDGGSFFEIFAPMIMVFVFLAFRTSFWRNYRYDFNTWLREKYNIYSTFDFEKIKYQFRFQVIFIRILETMLFVAAIIAFFVEGPFDPEKQLKFIFLCAGVVFYILSGVCKAFTKKIKWYELGLIVFIFLALVLSLINFASPVIRIIFFCMVFAIFILSIVLEIVERKKTVSDFKNENIDTQYNYQNFQ
jgi:hypothetical protein